MAKMTSSFKAKGELDMNSVVIYEVKNRGKKDEYMEEVNLLDFLKEFHGREVSISITEDKEVYRVEKLPDDEGETDEEEGYDEGEY